MSFKLIKNIYACPESPMFQKLGSSRLFKIVEEVQEFEGNYRVLANIFNAETDTVDIDAFPIGDDTRESNEVEYHDIKCVYDALEKMEENGDIIQWKKQLEEVMTEMKNETEPCVAYNFKIVEEEDDDSSSASFSSDESMIECEECNEKCPEKYWAEQDWTFCEWTNSYYCDIHEPPYDCGLEECNACAVFHEDEKE